MKKYTATITAIFTHVESKMKAKQSISISDNDRDIAVAAAMLQLANMRRGTFRWHEISQFSVEVKVN